MKSSTSGRDIRRVVLRMNNFVREYEKQCGNISATCEVTGITRRTYYDWMNGTAKHHKRFQHKILKTVAGERLIDAAESVIMRGLVNNDITAAIFTLKTRGKHRGWSEKADIAVNNLLMNGQPQTPQIDDRPLMDKIADACRACLDQFKDAITSEEMRLSIVTRFANARRVDPKELAERVGVVVDVEDR